ncbi:Nramp family divalent metal transporter [Solirubrobacter sp. CPCC 204708]|uniref:Nramp family divalent metal transporter n=1 Tax=Solirubrobacter deserti TaxID=2282478 RepID=A0ABT4RJ77_9ACTN|nr:Nramp family divalent metal transporter [Solirubrobacter deserti]MBE2317657.1 Nramp family divalent metal transporter [Solirubrobacter deserti]MDA0138607.1 Nramp family divalent metal transporter [Solirubrobacter deserti]
MSDRAFTSPPASAHLPEVEVRELPEPPKSMWRIIGPGVVGAGVGLASGEFILWPYISSQVGLVFLWAAFVGVIVQFFLNMEIERYTLATGETALTGFSRLWRHWGLFFVILIYFANLWPGWSTSSATLMTYLFGGGDPVPIAIGILVLVGLSLTLAPVVYDAVERVIFLKVALIVIFFGVAAFTAISGEAAGEVSNVVTSFGTFPGELDFAVLLGALAFAGAGGGQNLCQSNWIRDKGFGMGKYVPRLVSPVTGQEEAAPSTGFVFEPTERNLSRWRAWWRFANLEQLCTFVAITVITITFTSMLAYSTVFGQEGLTDDISFLEVEGNRLNELAGSWMGPLFWGIGAFSLLAASMGIVDYTSRVAADTLKVNYFRNSGLSESRLYFGLVWGLVIIGCLILLVGLDQPLILLVISACVGGVMMFVYSILLLIMNRRSLPEAIRVRGARVVVLLFSAGFFGVLSVITLIEEGRQLFE